MSRNLKEVVDKLDFTRLGVHTLEIFLLGKKNTGKLLLEELFLGKRDT